MNMPVLNPEIITQNGAIDLKQSVSSAPNAVDFAPSLKDEFNQHLMAGKIQNDQKGISSLNNLDLNAHEAQILRNFFTAWQNNLPQEQAMMQQVSLKEIAVPKSPASDAAQYLKSAYVPQQGSVTPSAEQLQSFKTGEPLPQGSVSSELPAPIQAFVDSLVDLREGYNGNLKTISGTLSKGAENLTQSDIIKIQTAIGINATHIQIATNSLSSAIGTLKQLLSSTS